MMWTSSAVQKENRVRSVSWTKQLGPISGYDREQVKSGSKYIPLFLCIGKVLANHSAVVGRLEEE